MKRFTIVKYLLWVYFFLLIFEGALRKWLFPGLSTPLLVIRDPVALAAVCVGWPYLVGKKWVWAFAAIALLAILPAYFVGHGNILVAFYGARVWTLHIPLIFLFAAVCTRDDVWTFGKALLLLAIPMALLAAAQYSLPQTHFLNRAPGGEEGVGFAGALGKFRPPGTFSFISGLSTFFGLSAAFFLAWVATGPRPLPKWLGASAGALVPALPVSVSRSLLYLYLLPTLATLFTGTLSPRLLARVFVGAVGVTAVISIAAITPIFQDGLKTFSARWEMGQEHEGFKDKGVVEGTAGNAIQRVIEPSLKAILRTGEVHPLGQGIGMGTNVGAVLLKGKRMFLLAEDSWSALLAELGPFIGLFLILLRCGLGLYLLLMALSSLRNGNALPLILGSVSIVWVVFGDTAQPTALGFLIVGAGLTLAAANPSKKEILHEHRVKLELMQLRHKVAANTPDMGTTI